MTKSIFKQIDQALNEQIKEVRSSSGFQKLSEGLRGFSESEQTIINQATNIVIILLPIVLIVVALLYRSTISTDLETRTKVQDQIIDIKEETRNLSLMSRNSLSKVQIDDKRSLVQEINNIATRKKISPQNITVDHFNKSVDGGTISKVNSTVIFKDLTTKAFSDFLLTVQTKLKASVTDIEVSKNETSKLLYGSMEISIYTKAQ